MSQLGIMLRKTMQKSLICFLFGSHDDSSGPVPSTSSELVDDRLSTQEGKQALPVPVKGPDLTRHQ